MINATLRSRTLTFLTVALALVCGALSAPYSSAAAAPNSGAAAENSPLLFEFGLVADIQYASKADVGQRSYRASIAKLRPCVAEFNREPLAFAVSLGDLIDGNGEASLADLRAVLDTLKPLVFPMRHVIGNHCLAVERPQLLSELALSSAYYTFARPGWRFIVLDGMDVSSKTPPGSPEAAEYADYLKVNSGLASYNGAVGKRQLAWLRSALSDSRLAGERVVLFVHHPLLEASSDPGLLLWNAAEVRQLLEESGNVVACFNGHDHRGGYGQKSGIHYVTLAGMVEAANPTYALARVYPDRITLAGRGAMPSRVLAFSPTPKPWPRYEALENGPAKLRLLPGHPTFAFTMYGCPEDVTALRALVECMQTHNLGNGFDPGPFAVARNRPAFEYLATVGWPIITYPPRYGEFQVKDGRSRLDDPDEQALQALDQAGSFCGIQLGEWGYYFHNLSFSESWWRSVYGAEFETMKSRMKPAGLAGYDRLPTSKPECYAILKDYFLTRHRALRGRTVSVTGHSHYEAYAAEWGATLIGLELGENIGYSQSKIAFARGASRQWGQPWSVQVSPWMGPTCTTAGPLVKRNGITFGADAGHSLSLYQRLWRHSWFAGAALVTPENSSAIFFETNHPYVLSSFGHAASQVHTFMQRHDRGIPYTPLGVVLDRYAGFNGYMGKPWGILPPTPGDQELTDLLLRQLYPGRDHIHEGHDPANPEATFLLPTPFGEIADVLLSTAKAEVLASYPVLLVAGDLSEDPEFVAELFKALRRGSRLWLLPRHAQALKNDFARLRGTGRVEILDAWTNPATGRAAAVPNEKLLGLTKELMPIRVTGDSIQYQINRNHRGWVVELVNNRGVIKFGDRPATIDPAAQATVQLSTDESVQSIVRWNLDADIVLSKALPLTVTIGPGETAFIEFVAP